VHGDVEGAENVRQSLSDWLRFIRLAPAGPQAELDRYIGCWKPHALSHEELDHDTAMVEEVRNVARSLAEGVAAKRPVGWKFPARIWLRQEANRRASDAMGAHHCS
jgi:hypothetical protein